MCGMQLISKIQTYSEASTSSRCFEGAEFSGQTTSLIRHLFSKWFRPKHFLHCCRYAGHSFRMLLTTGTTVNDPRWLLLIGLVVFVLMVVFLSLIRVVVVSSLFRVVVLSSTSEVVGCFDLRGCFEIFHYLFDAHLMLWVDWLHPTYSFLLQRRGTKKLLPLLAFPRQGDLLSV